MILWARENAKRNDKFLGKRDYVGNLEIYGLASLKAGLLRANSRGAADKLGAERFRLNGKVGLIIYFNHITSVFHFHYTQCATVEAELGKDGPVSSGRRERDRNSYMVN